MPTISGLQVTPNLATRRTQLQGSTAGPSSFPTAPPPPTPPHLRPPPPSRRQLPPSRPCSPAWCPLTTPTPPRLRLHPPHPSLRPALRPPVATPHPHPPPSSKPTPRQAPRAGPPSTFLPPPSTEPPGLTPPPPPAVAPTTRLMPTPWAALSRRFTLRTTSRGTATPACTRKQVTPPAPSSGATHPPGRPQLHPGPRLQSCQIAPPPA